MPIPRRRSPDGFTLAEVLVAMLCLATLAAGVGAIVGVALGAVRTARTETSTTALAVRRMEELKSDPLNSAALLPSPSDALTHDEPGYVDYFDGHGQVVAGASPPSTAVFICRWSVAALPSDETVLVLRVLSTTVAAARLRAAGGGPGGDGAADTLLLDFRRQDGP